MKTWIRQEEASITQEKLDSQLGALALDAYCTLGIPGLSRRSALCVAASWDGNWLFMEKHEGLTLEVTKNFLIRALADPPFDVRRIYVDSSSIFTPVGRVARGMGIDCQPIKYSPLLKGRVERLIQLMRFGCLPAGVYGIWTDGNEIRPLTRGEQ